ncbi:hypothetical protein ACI65C_013344 [Semiaphis heraclei]
MGILANGCIGERIYWRCERKDECPARVHTNIGSREIIFRSKKTHTHASNVAKVIALEATTEMVKNATLGLNSAQQIVGEATQNLNDAVLAQLPKLSTLKRKLRRVKERATWHPPCPTSIRDLMIPEQYKCLSDGSQFLLHDSGVHDDERFIIVGSMTGLRALSMSARWHADGTFKTTPLIFKQLYSIHAEIGNNSLVAGVFILMTRMTEEAYTKCFSRRPMRRTRRTSKFQPKLWNLYEAAIHGLARTNNGLEGWHNGFQKQVSGHHVSIWKMFEGLQREVRLAKLKVAHVEAGKEEKQKSKWKRTTENIKTKAENYSNQDIIPYLKSLAYNIDF